MTYDDLVKHEPALKGLLRFAKRCKGEPMWLVIKVWLDPLVGVGRPGDHPILSTPQAYQVAMKRLRDAMETGR